MAKSRTVGSVIGTTTGRGPARFATSASAYVVYYPDLAFPGAADTIRAFAKTAVESGVRRLVLLSGRGEPEALPSEQAVRDAGAEWTILRASWFAQNFSEHFLLEPVLERRHRAARRRCGRAVHRRRRHRRRWPSPR